MPTYNPGDFSFCQDPENVIMLTEAYNAITVTDSWNKMKLYPVDKGWLLFGSKPDLAPTEVLIKYRHSQRTYQWTMRNMQSIAEHGWDAYIGVSPTTDSSTHLFDCCNACYKQSARNFLYTPASGESVWGHSWRINSHSEELEWDDEPPCPRGLLICYYCNNLARCYSVGIRATCGKCFYEYGETR